MSTNTSLAIPTKRKSKKLQTAIDTLKATGNFMIYEKLKPSFCRKNSKDDEIRSAIYVDTETTGLNPDTDKIIEIAVVPFKYNGLTGEIVEFIEKKAFSCFEDPGFPLSEEIVRLTGITDEDVQGKRLDDVKINKAIKSSVLVISHHAGFDRPFLEKRLPFFQDINWACSLTDINWSAEYISSGKLEYIAFKYGFYYDAHRALNDCFAGVEILTRRLPESGRNAMKVLLESARRVDTKMKLIAPFEMNDKIKELGGKWEPDTKTWYCYVNDVELDEFKQRAAEKGVQTANLGAKITSLNRFRQVKSA